MIPRERVIIDAISLDEEIQLEGEIIAEEMRHIHTAWKKYDPRATWSQPLPMQTFRPRPQWGLNAAQVEFLSHIIYQGEIGRAEAIGLVHRLSFRSGRDLLSGRFPQISMDMILASADLMTELRGAL